MGKDTIEEIIIPGMLRWATVHTPRGTKASPEDKRYSIDVEVTDDLIATLIEKGVRIGTDSLDKKVEEENGVKYINISRKAKNAKGEVTGPVPVFNEALQPITDLIGNGSVGRVKASLIPVKGQTIMYLKAVQVLDLIPYAGGVTSGFEAVAPEVDGGSEDLPF